MVISALIGALSGGLGSWVTKGLGLYEKRMQYEHELKLLDMQMKVRQSETESELAIAQEQSYAGMREASYQHDSGVGETSLWVNNTLRMVRPLLTIFLIALVGMIWATTNDPALMATIADGVIYMATTALTWWFGDRAAHMRKLPWR